MQAIITLYSGKFWYLLLGLLVFSSAAQAHTTIGTVFGDVNANGTRDANEFGIGGITVYAFVNNDPARATPLPNAHVATTWADMTVQIMTKAPKNTPTYGSRALGYLGLTMYETVVGSSKKYRSIARSICDTLHLPRPDRHLTYCPELALNAGQAYMLNALYGYTKNTRRIDSLAEAMHRLYAAQNPPDVVARSEAYGHAVAEKIYQWSRSDGGHEGYDRNFPADYVLPKGTGYWTPPLIGQSSSKIPMHPAWGQNRTFVARNSQLPLPKPLTYSTDSTSEYYRQFKEVYARSYQLTEAERAIVMWWGDDPNQTCSPPGHSYQLATLAIQKSGADLVKATQTYCRVGIAVADAFIVCWKAKFAYVIERPSTFVKSVIRRECLRTDSPYWYPFFPEPPFPAFYSGHATQSSATATVLTALYGDGFSFTDDTHKTRPPTGYQDKGQRKLLHFTPRTYTSFWEAARECAESRLLGGIHTRYDNEVGLTEGSKIGRQINKLRW